MNSTLCPEITLGAIESLAKQLLKKNWLINDTLYNLTKLGWSFKFNRQKESLGFCCKITKEIFLSKHLFDANKDDIKIWDDTIRHEIAHALDNEIRGKSDHGIIWQNIAMQVGAQPIRCHVGTPLKRKNPKYTLKCTNCNYEVYKHRKSKTAQACGKCCKEHNEGKFTDKYIFNIEVNF